MSKKDKVVDTDTSEVKANTPRVLNLVTMTDGTQVNFGSRSNVVSAMDLETATITFKLSTGVLINWLVLSAVEGLTDFQKMVFMYGVLEKVKSSLAPVKKEGLEEAINKQIAAINDQKFNIRSIGSAADTGLTMIMQAFALAKSKLDSNFIHWSNLEDTTVIKEVYESWMSKDAKTKNAARKNPWVAAEYSLLMQAADPDAGKDL